MDLSIATLKATGARPHYFGLGFIQLKLSVDRRLHFWVPDWPTIPGNDTEIHNHRYGFSSTILAGALEQVVYKLGRVYPHPLEGSMEMVEVSCQPGQEGKPLVLGYVLPEATVAHTFKAGDSYALSPDDFHIAHPLGNTITQVIRGPVEHENARVIRPIGSQLVCPFSLAKSEDECWEKMAHMVEQLS